MRRAAKKDTCHRPITNALRQAGCTVIDLSALGNGAPDAIVFKGDRIRLHEYKSKYGQFTPDQIKWQHNHPDIMQYYRKIKSVGEAFEDMRIEFKP